MSAISKVSRRTYLFVYLALMLLLASTVGAAFLPLGPFQTVISVAIAVAKAILVLLFFMHLRQTKVRTTFLILGGMLLLLILFTLTTIDYATRIAGLPLTH